jgi:HNH endonuclease
MPGYLFCNIAWMKSYQGVQMDDQPIGGGSNEEKHEACNFLAVDGEYYGFVQLQGGIDLYRIDSGFADGEDQLDGVTVIWTAKHPTEGGSRVVGWYRNATVYKEWRNSRPYLSPIHRMDKIRGYIIRAPSIESRLLEPNERTVVVPRRSGRRTAPLMPGWGFGMQQVCYAMTEDGDLNRYFERDAKDVIRLIGDTALRPSFRESQREIETDIESDETLNSTVKSALIDARRGQGLFRTRALELANSRCPISGVEHPQLLRASHIKPWARCETHDERLDGHNGLILSPAVDHLFDLGLITFEEDGKLAISEKVSNADRNALGFKLWKQSLKLSEQQKLYMRYHRQNIFQC